MKHFYDIVLTTRNGLNIPAPGVSVTVNQQGTMTPAVLYSDDGITVKTNPVATDASGRYDFYVPNGRYDLVFTGTGFTSVTQFNVEITDAMDTTALGKTVIAFTANNTHSGAESFSGSLGIPSGASNPALCSVGNIFFNTTLGTMQNCTAINTWTGVGGGVSPTSLTNFFSGYSGLSPKDCSTASCNTPGIGAKGDWHSFFDCTITANTTAFSCTGSHFTSTAVDGGKTVEFACSASAPQVTTIASVQSATQATLAANTCSVTQTNQAFAFGTDDTVPLRNWAAFISAAFSTTSTTPSVRGGYLPRGQYYTTKAVRFIGPGNVQPTLANNGECTKISGGTIWCPLMLTGDGAWASTIVGSSNFVWSADGTATNTGLCYFNNWSGSFITNMGCAWAMGQEQGFSTNTTGQTGLVGTWLFDNNQHTKWDSNFAYGAHGSPVLVGGLVISKDFESEYSNSAVEFNDINLLIGPEGVIGNTYEKIVFDTLFCEGGGGAQGNIQIAGGTYKQTTFRNVHSRDGSSSVNIRSGVVATSANDALVFDRFRQTTNNAGTNQGFVVQSAVKLEFNNPYFEDTGAQAGAVLMTVTAAATINIFGGAVHGASLTNAINSSSTPAIYAYGTQFPDWSVANILTGTGSLFAFIPTATGWNGRGIAESTSWIADQGIALSNGSIGTLTGWGTGATAAVCATPQPGFSQTGCFTITSGSASFAAAPSVTVTLPNALPTANTPCTLDVIDITGAGGAIMWKQTTNSATAPVFTAKTNTGAAFTPAASETYTMMLRCGP